MREVKQVSVYAKALESYCKRAETGILAQGVCACVCKRERGSEWEKYRWSATEAYWESLVMAN